MKITEISVFQADLPLKEGFKISNGRVMRLLDTTLVRIDTDAGISGWGETCPWGTDYLPASALTARAAIADLAPLLIGADPRDLVKNNFLMDDVVYGQPHAKAALDVAMWDVLGKSQDMPIFQLLGGRLNDAPTVNLMIPCDVGDDLSAAIIDRRARGMTQYSLKATGSNTTDIELLNFVGERMQPGESIKLDVNRGWFLRDALEVSSATEHVNIHFEQPCASYEDCKTFRQTTGRITVLDECATDLSVVLRAHADGVLDALNLKISRVGGMTKARVIRDVCMELGVPCFIQEPGGGDLAFAATAQLAHSIPKRLFNTSWNCAEVLSVSIAETDMVLKDASVRMGNSPGLGVKPHMHMLGEPVAIYQ